MRLPLVLVGVVCLVSACQTPLNIQQLENENSALQQQLSSSNQQLELLQADKEVLQNDMTELQRVMGVLGEEKSSRVTESTNLRGEVRQFVQLQMDSLKQFLLASDLLDYIGGETVARSKVDENPLLVVDLYNAVPRNGILTGLRGHFQSPGSLSVRVLRPVEDDLVVIWASQSIEVQGQGEQQLKFPVSVGVEKGDVLAYYFAQPGMVSFDTGTGDSRYSSSDKLVGNIVRPSSLKGASDKRAYSVGVFGLLNTGAN
jgi:hypothetical protein